MRRLAAAISIALAAAFIPNGYREYRHVEQEAVEPSQTSTGGVAPRRTPAGEVVAPSSTPSSTDGRPAGTARPSQSQTGRSVFGVASTYGSSQYDGLFAVPIREWPGHRVRVCYRDTCVIRTVNDYGPDQRVWPGRVADLDGPTFNYLCECDWRVVGVLRGVELTLLD